MLRMDATHGAIIFTVRLLYLIRVSSRAPSTLRQRFYSTENRVYQIGLDMSSAMY